MAKIYISEFTSLGWPVAGTMVPVSHMPPLVQQAVTYSTSTQSAPFNVNTVLIRVVADAKAHISFGENPTATADSVYIAADSPEYFKVKSGDRVAAYDGTS